MGSIVAARQGFQVAFGCRQGYLKTGYCLKVIFYPYQPNFTFPTKRRIVAQVYRPCRRENLTGQKAGAGNPALAMGLKLLRNALTDKRRQIGGKIVRMGFRFLDKGKGI